MDKEKKNNDFKDIVYPLSLITQIGITVSITAGVFILGGKYLDDTLKTSPLFILLGGLLAFVASMYTVYILVLPIVKKSQESDKKTK